MQIMELVIIYDWWGGSDTLCADKIYRGFRGRVCFECTQLSDVHQLTPAVNRSYEHSIRELLVSLRLPQLDQWLGPLIFCRGGGHCCISRLRGCVRPEQIARLTSGTKQFDSPKIAH